MENFFKNTTQISAMLKSLFRNQSIFVWRSAKQTDQKANMLISIGFYAWLAVIIIANQFDTYLHFPVWLLLIPIVLTMLCILECLFTIRPNTRFRQKQFEEYSEKKYNNIFGYFPDSLAETEESMNQMVNNHSLQIGNLVRDNFLAMRAINKKFGHMDRAYNFFLAGVISMLVLFLVNVVMSGGYFHEHNQRLTYIPYDFENPTASFILDKELEEISGLSFDSTENILFAVNDEKGKFYRLSASSGSIIGESRFDKKGDYEGIELIGNQIVINNSRGDIYLTDLNGEETVVQHTALNKKNNVEGICVDPNDGLLLIACKGDPWHSNADKVILKYDLTIGVLDSLPFLEIYVKDLQEYVDSSYKDFMMKRAIQRRLSNFSPSGVAVDKVTNDIYVLTARGSILVVYNEEKKIKDIIHLNELNIPQPEGICFDNKNNLYIATEANNHGGAGKIYKYKAIDF